MRGTGQVWRALDRARAINLSKAGAAPARTGADGITRRRVLAALGGGLAAAAWPRWPAFARSPLRVAVVGGGLAGLSALDVLRRNGAEAVLYEARTAAGGRTRSVRGVFAPDYAFDEGAQLVNSDHADVLAMVRRFDLPLVDRRAHGPHHEVQIGRGGRPVDEAALAQALRGIAAAITADSDRLDADYAGVAAEIDALSVQDYLDRHGLAPGDARDAIEATVRTEYGAEPNEASALELLFNLPTVDGERVSRISLSDERYLIDGGTGQIAAALAHEHRQQIHLGATVAGIAAGPAGMRLTFADGRTAQADQVVLALPAPLLKAIRIEGVLPPLARAMIDEVRPGRNEKLIVGYDSQPWRHSTGFAGAVWAADGFSAIWDAASQVPAGGSGALCYFLGGDQVREAADVETRRLAERFTAPRARSIRTCPIRTAAPGARAGATIR
nr:FAD-dependent oxidoreductase [Sphingosinicella terrae]